METRPAVKLVPTLLLQECRRHYGTPTDIHGILPEHTAGSRIEKFRLIIGPSRRMTLWFLPIVRKGGWLWRR